MLVHNLKKVQYLGWMIFLLFVTGMLLPASVYADGGDEIEDEIEQKETVYMTATNMMVGKAKLEREGDGVELKFRTSKLPAYEAVTLWWVVFNHPEYCQGPCGPDDVFGPNGPINNGDGTFGRPGVEVSSLWATGGVVGANGKIKLKAELQKGNAPGELQFGNGLQNVMGAEIHVIVRVHGTASSDPALLYAQTHTFGGGCDINACFNPQHAIFGAP